MEQHLGGKHLVVKAGSFHEKIFITRWAPQSALGYSTLFVGDPTSNGTDPYSKPYVSSYHMGEVENGS